MAILGLTVKVCVALTELPQPPDIVYVITEVPAVTAVTTPVEEPTVATDVVPLVHTPLPLPPRLTPTPLYVVELPMHNGLVPDTELMAMFGLTVSVCEALTELPQPPVMVYTILLVPDASAVTRPDALTVATDVLLLLHAPLPLPPRFTPVVL